MNTKPTGGPAFPGSEEVTYENGTRVLEHHSGMSLRDYFAGVALAGMMNAPMGKYLHRDTATMVLDAYKVADQMIEQRVK